jgi:hypothetical protein
MDKNYTDLNNHGADCIMLYGTQINKSCKIGEVTITPADGVSFKTFMRSAEIIGCTA